MDARIMGFWPVEFIRIIKAQKMVLNIIGKHLWFASCFFNSMMLELFEIHVIFVIFIIFVILIMSVM